VERVLHPSELNASSINPAEDFVEFLKSL